MAGNYPDAPSRRLAYDADGTVVWYVTHAAGTYVPPAPPTPPDFPLSILSAAGLQALNGEDNTPGLTNFTDTIEEGGIWAFMIFPDLRDIDGYYWNLFTTGFGTWGDEWLYYSTDTTTGYDGTWSALGSQVYSQDWLVNPDYRDSIQTATVTGVKGLRFGSDVSVNNIAQKTHEHRALHLYGTVAASGANADRLIFLDTSDSDAEYTVLIDDGDVGRGADTAFNFKAKNNSSTKQANTVAVTATAALDDSDGWFTFATTELGTYSATLALGNIASSGTVTVYVKKEIPDGQTLGLHAGRIALSKASWT